MRSIQDTPVFKRKRGEFIMRFMVLALLAPFVLILLAAAPAHAIYTTNVADFTDYQIGDEWGKATVTPEIYAGRGGAFKRAAVATARVGGATGFYLGKFNGHHMMATNHHVMPNGRFCDLHRNVKFPIMGKQFACEKYFGHWTAIDLALFSITVTSKEDEEKLERVGRNFNFHANIYPGEELVTIGFGMFRNESRSLVFNDDGDCKVFSEKNDFRFINDPDRINPAEYKAWSFVTGCDVSHGDSGSAIVDRQSGDVLGIIWTTATQKPDRIRSSKYLDEALKKQSDDVWNWLSYAVPAQKIKAYLEEFLAANPSSDQDLVNTLHELLEK